MTNVVAKKALKASIVSVILCIALMYMTKVAQYNGDLWRAFVLIVTANVVMIVYLLGIRKYMKEFFQEREK